MRKNETDWWFFALPLWKMVDFVSWDDDIPNIWNNKIHVPNHQPGNISSDQNGDMAPTFSVLLQTIPRDGMNSRAK